MRHKSVVTYRTVVKLTTCALWHMCFTHDGLLRHVADRGRRRSMAMEMEVGDDGASRLQHLGAPNVEESSTERSRRLATLRKKTQKSANSTQETQSSRT